MSPVLTDSVVDYETSVRRSTWRAQLRYA